LNGCLIRFKNSAAAELPVKISRLVFIPAGVIQLNVFESRQGFAVYLSSFAAAKKGYVYGVFHTNKFDFSEYAGPHATHLPKSLNSDSAPLKWA